jgi:hypothetical protein
MTKSSYKRLRGSKLRSAMSVAAHALAVFSLTATISAFSSQNPSQSAVVSGGTVSAQSATHRVSGAVGQVASSRGSSSTHTVAGGFWNTVGLCDCPHIGDLDTNGVISISDVVLLVNVAFRGAAIPPSDPLCPLVTRADVTCNGTVSVQDVVVIVNAAFRGTDDRCDPCEQ